MNYFRTKDILTKFNISRQTLYNWIKNKEISNPQLDWRGWRIWNEENIQEIDNLINIKLEKQIEKSFFNQKREVKYLNINNRRYLGSKFKLLNFIKDVVENECGEFSSFADIFAGTGVVANLFNKPNIKVIVNDILVSNYISYKCWFDSSLYDKDKIQYFIDKYNTIIINDDNYFSDNFGNKYFTLENARKIGYIREDIEFLHISNLINEREKAILITSLLYAMDKVANTVGHYDAYRRTLNSKTPLQLLMPNINNESNKNNEIYNINANELVRNIYADIIYIDPPYNSRQYIDAYHLLENVALWNKPPVEGVAAKMIGRDKMKSDYCTAKAPIVFEDLINHISAKYILVSYNNMGNKGVGRSNAKLTDDVIIEILSNKGEVKVFEKDFHYYTTGKTKLTDHKERLFLCLVKK